MGNICDCLHNVFCCGFCGSKNRNKERKRGTPDRDDLEPNRSPKTEYKADIDDDEEEIGLITEEKLRQEALKAYKGGQSSYASLKGQMLKEQVKQMELKIVKKFCEKRGYECLKVVGSGKYAQVFKVLSSKKNKTYAVKVIDCSKIGTNYRTNFLPNEIKILRQLQKQKLPNIVKVSEVAQQMQRVWVVMEFAQRGSMADYIRDNGALTEEASHSFLIPILNGVHALHVRNIAHRDLKLENILLSKKFVPKISDFSYALEVNPKSPLNTQYCGSFIYMAPEVIQRLPYNPLCSDIWSLGVCFYILLNDGLPFKVDDTDSVVLQKQLEKKWKFRNKIESKLSPEIKEIVTSMMEPNTDLRPSTQQLKSKPWIQRYDTTKTLA